MAGSIDVIIVGGGVIGLAIARSAAERGAQVIVLEADRIGQGASYGNAGLIVPSFSLPLANPAAIKGLPDLLWGQDRSLKLKPRLELGFLRWTLQFFAASRRDKMLATARARGRLAAHSLDLMTQWDPGGEQFGLKQRGWLHLYQTAAGLKAGRQEASLLGGFGVKVEQLTGAEARALEPALADDLAGALYYPLEAQVDPYNFCQWLAERAVEKGVQIIESAPVENLISEATGVVGVQLADEQVRADKIVVAAGAWTGRLVRPLLGWLPLEPAKGYSLTYPSAAQKPSRPLMWVEKHVVMTPFEAKLRVTTGLDLVGFSDGLDNRMVAKLEKTAASWVGESRAQAEANGWYGYRPLTADGRPILGPSSRYPNLYLATGHGQLGVTLAAGSADLIASMLAAEEPPLDPSQFSPSRLGL